MVDKVVKNVKGVGQVVVVSADAAGNYHLPQEVQAGIAKVDVADIDIVLTTKGGEHYILPGAAIAAMNASPPTAIFSDSSVVVSHFLNEVGTISNLADNIPLSVSVNKQADANTESDQKSQCKEQQSQTAQDVSALQVDTDASVEKLVQNVQNDNDALHDKNYDYVPPHQYDSPPNPLAPPPAEPAPISGTPQISVYMGNVTTTGGSGNIIYGSGGDVSSGADALIANRDALQFSAAVITGTAGNDLIYAEGELDLIAGINPATVYPSPGVINQSIGVKQLYLNLVGAYVSISNISFSGVPADVSIVGATRGALDPANGTYTWNLPLTSIKNQTIFSLIYDLAGHASGTTFSIQADISGTGTHSAPFHSKSSLTFEYLAATSVSDVTNPFLGNNYVLPTLDQPNFITSGNGNDTIYGGRSNDTIISGNGNDLIYGANGNDSITTGSGNSTIQAGNGNNTVTVGDGVNNILLGNGNNTVVSGNGGDSIVAGNGANSITSGTGADTITAGNGANIINDAGGNNVINVGSGNNTIDVGVGVDSITAGAGNNTITAAGGGGTIDVGAGNNTIAINSAASSTDTYNITATGSGNTTITGGDDKYNIALGTGSSSVNLGAGNDTINIGSAGGYATGNSAVTVGAGNSNITIYSTSTEAITTSSGSDSITINDNSSVAGIGGGTISIEGGSTAVTINSASGSTNTYNLINTGNSTITGGDDNYNVNLSAGSSSVTLGKGNDSFTLAGAGNDSITVGGASDSVTGVTSVSGSAATGNESLLIYSLGTETITTGSGNDSVTINDSSSVAGIGGGSITLGTGTNVLAINSASGSTNTYNLTNTGNSTITGGDDNYNVNLSAGSSSVTLGKGNDTFTLAGAGNDSITVGGVSDSVTGATSVNGSTATGNESLLLYSLGTETITTGSGNDSVTINDSSVTGGGGTINVGAGSNVVSINSASGSTNTYTLTSSGNSTITGGDDNYNVNLSAGSSSVTLGKGNDSFTLAGAGNDSITVGGVSDSVTGVTSVSGSAATGNESLLIYSLGTETITTGSGNDSVTINDSSSVAGIGGGTINVGAGSNVVSINSASGSTNTYSLINSGNSTITGGDDNYNVNLSAGSSSVTLGKGNDNFTLAGAGNDSITVGGVSDSVTGVTSVNGSAATGNESLLLYSLGTETITTGSGNDSVTINDSSSVAGIGGGTINVGSGSNTIAINSASNSTNTYTLINTGNSTITGGDDNYNASLGTGSNSVNLGKGNDTITAGSVGTYATGSNAVTVGAGNSSVSVYSTGATSITAGSSGSDTITLNNAGTVAGGGGTITTSSGTGTATIAITGNSNSANTYNVTGTGTGSTTITGSSSNSADAYLISLASGNDSISTTGGAHTIAVGEGNDTISLSGAGINNVTIGSAGAAGATGGNSVTLTNTGNSNIYDYSSGSNTVTAGGGNYSIVIADVANPGVSSANDSVSLGAGNSTVAIYNVGNSTISAGGGGNDTLNVFSTNGSSVDTFLVGLGSSSITGGNGTNNYNFSPLSSALTFTYAAGNATVTGTGVNDTISASGGGVSNFYMSSGADTVNVTGTGVAAFYGDTAAGSGSNTFNAGLGADSFYAGSGNDTFNPSTVSGSGVSYFYGDSVAGGGNITFNGAGTSTVASVAHFYGGTGNNIILTPHPGDVYSGTPQSGAYGAAIASSSQNTNLLVGTYTVTGASYNQFVNFSNQLNQITYSTPNLQALQTAYNTALATYNADTTGGFSANLTDATNLANAYNAYFNTGNYVNLANSTVVVANFQAEATIASALAYNPATETVGGYLVHTVGSGNTTMQGGTGLNGEANGSQYLFTGSGATSNTINSVIMNTGEAANTLISSTSNSLFIFGSNNDTIRNFNSLYDATATGSNTLATQQNILVSGGQNLPINQFYMGLAQEEVIVTAPSTNVSTAIHYDYSPEGIVLNLTTVSSANFNGGINNIAHLPTLAALTGGEWTTDVNSYSQGDTYIAPKGAAAPDFLSINSLFGSTVAGADANIVYFGNGGDSVIYTGNASGSDYIYITGPNTTITYNMSNGSDQLYGYSSAANIVLVAQATTAETTIVLSKSLETTYSGLDGIGTQVSTNVSSLPSQTGVDGITYSGFASVTGQSGQTLLNNIDNIRGGNNSTSGAGMVFVGDNNADQVYPTTAAYSSATNYIYDGLGADTASVNDTIFAGAGNNYVYFGIDTQFSGTLNLSTVPFSSPATFTTGISLSEVVLGNSSFFGASDQAALFGSHTVTAAANAPTGETNYGMILTGSVAQSTADYSYVYNPFNQPNALTGSAYNSDTVPNAFNYHAADTVAGVTFENTIYDGILYGDANTTTIDNNNRGTYGNYIFAGGANNVTISGYTANNIFYESASTLYNGATGEANVGNIGGTTGINTLRIPGLVLNASAAASDPLSSLNATHNTHDSGKFTGIDVLDLRTGYDTITAGTSPTGLPDLVLSIGTSAQSNTIKMDANDITNLHSNIKVSGSPIVTLYLDSGDTFTPYTTGTTVAGSNSGALSFVENSGATGTDQQWRFYSNAGHTLYDTINLVGQVNVHFGA